MYDVLEIKGLFGINLRIHNSQMNCKPAKKQRLILCGQSIPELKTTRYHFACRIRQYKSPYLRVASNLTSDLNYT